MRAEARAARGDPHVLRAEIRDRARLPVSLRFKDGDGRPRLTVGTENGAALIVLNEQGGKLRAELSLNRDGDPALTFNDRDGFATWKTTGR